MERALRFLEKRLDAEETEADAETETGVPADKLTEGEEDTEEMRLR